MSKRSQPAAKSTTAAKTPAQSAAADPRDGGPPAAVAPTTTAPFEHMEPRPKKKRAEETVSVTVPTAFQLTDDDGGRHHYQPGIQDMPASHATHFYAKAHGVEINE